MHPARLGIFISASVACQGGYRARCFHSWSKELCLPVRRIQRLSHASCFSVTISSPVLPSSHSTRSQNGRRRPCVSSYSCPLSAIRRDHRWVLLIHQPLRLTFSIVGHRGTFSETFNTLLTSPVVPFNDLAEADRNPNLPSTFPPTLQPSPVFRACSALTHTHSRS